MIQSLSLHWILRFEGGGPPDWSFVNPQATVSKIYAKRTQCMPTSSSEGDFRISASPSRSTVGCLLNLTSWIASRASQGLEWSQWWPHTWTGYTDRWWGLSLVRLTRSGRLWGMKLYPAPRFNLPDFRKFRVFYWWFLPPNFPEPERENQLTWPLLWSLALFGLKYFQYLWISKLKSPNIFLRLCWDSESILLKLTNFE